MLIGIGEFVPAEQRNYMSAFIHKYGEEAFYYAVYQGAWNEIAYAYIHPSEEMKATKDFETIQRAFLNAYV